MADNQSNQETSLTLDISEIYGEQPVRAVSGTSLTRVKFQYGVHIEQNGTQYRISPDAAYKNSLPEKAAEVLTRMHMALAKAPTIDSVEILNKTALREVIAAVGGAAQRLRGKNESAPSINPETVPAAAAPTIVPGKITPSRKNAGLVFADAPTLTMDNYQRHALADIHGYLSRQNRSNFLDEFEKRMGVRVQLNDSLGFDVFLPRNHEGPIDTLVVSQIQIALMNLQTRREKGQPVTRNCVRHEVNQAVAGRLTPAFAKEAKASVENELTNTETAAPELQRPSGRAARPINFDLPLFDETGHLEMFGTNGREKIWDLTANQRAYKDAMFDPDTQLIAAHGAAGSAKTDIMIWSALRMLQLGLIQTIYYERPVVTVGAIKLGAFPGGFDDKTGPYSDVFVRKMVEWLSNGNMEKGKKVFGELKKRGCIQEYGGMLKAGDTITDAILLVDEAQNKNRTELFHLGSRAGDNAKVVISGDYEFQNSLNNGMSGLKDFIEILGMVPLSKIFEMVEADCKRSELVRQLYMASKAFDEARRGKARPAPDLHVVGPSHKSPAPG